MWNPFKRKRNSKEQTRVMLDMVIHARRNPSVPVRTTKTTGRNSNLKEFTSWEFVSGGGGRGRSFKIGDDIFVFSTRSK